MSDAALAIARPAEAATWTPSFAMAVPEMKAQLDAKRDFLNLVMRAGEHYGPIPGADQKKKVLLKPGAEVLLSNMGLRAVLSDAEPPIRDYGDGGREGMIVYRRVCQIYKQTGATEHERMLIAQAEGSCSSWESKYRWRNAQRTCPECGKSAIIKGKAEYGGGFICFKKKDGCGAKFADNDPRVTSQEVGRIPNPDIADVENTILKMADKRAMVAATLIATGCSDIFTQDVGDMDDVPDGHAGPSDAQEAQFTERPAPAPQAAPAAKTVTAKRDEVLAELRQLREAHPALAEAALKATFGRSDAIPKGHTLAQLVEVVAAINVAAGPESEEQYAHIMSWVTKLQLDAPDFEAITQTIVGKPRGAALSHHEAQLLIEYLSRLAADPKDDLEIPF